MADTVTAPANVKIKFGGKGKPMAKEKPAGEAPKPDNDYEAEDALRTMTRAEEHQGDADLMKRVGKHAKQKSDDMAKVMENLRKRGLVSDKQAEKVARRSADAK